MLHLTPGLRSVILTNCITQAPHEACGFLLGRDGHVVFAMPMPNTADDPHHRYRITPDAAAGAVRTAMRLGVDIIGGWHSHPDGPDVLSLPDQRSSPGPEFLHLLVGRGWTLQAFRVLRPSRVVAVPIRCGDGDSNGPGVAASTGDPVA